MQKGFSGIYKKIDVVCTKYDESIDSLEDKITALDTEMKVRKAVNGVKKEGRDYWLWIIRAVSISCILAVIAFILNKIIIPAL